MFKTDQYYNELEGLKKENIRLEDKLTELRAKVDEQNSMLKRLQRHIRKITSENNLVLLHTFGEETE